MSNQDKKPWLDEAAEVSLSPSTMLCALARLLNRKRVQSLQHACAAVMLTAFCSWVGGAAVAAGVPEAGGCGVCS